jgi:hypothetical protein
VDDKVPSSYTGAQRASAQPLGDDCSVVLIQRWSPITSDIGLIQVSPSELTSAFLEWQESLHTAWRLVRVEAGLAATFDALLPLSQGMRRRAFVATRSGWTAQFQNGIQGSDPFPAMSLFARKLGVLAMRICRSPQAARHPATIWEVYAPPNLGGNEYGFRRSVSVANDGGTWTFDESGEPYAFENVATYSVARKRDRFTPEMLEKYLTEFDLHPFDEDFYCISSATPAVILERPAYGHEPPDFTLQEVAEGRPWVRR